MLNVIQKMRFESLLSRCKTPIDVKFIKDSIQTIQEVPDASDNEIDRYADYLETCLQNNAVISIIGADPFEDF